MFIEDVPPTLFGQYPDRQFGSEDGINPTSEFVKVEIHELD